MTDDFIYIIYKIKKQKKTKKKETIILRNTSCNQYVAIFDVTQKNTKKIKKKKMKEHKLTFGGLFTLSIKNTTYDC